MKKFTVFAASIFIALSAFCQDDAEKEFTFSIRTGLGVPLNDDYGLLVEIGAQGEYRISERFSIYIPLQYQPEVGLDGIAFGYLGLLAGPRYYASQKFFVGIGGGYALYLYEGFSYSGFVYQPHIGLNLRKTQWTLGYYSGVVGEDEAGFVDLKVAFKIGRRQQ